MIYGPRGTVFCLSCLNLKRVVERVECVEFEECTECIDGTKCVECVAGRVCGEKMLKYLLQIMLICVASQRYTVAMDAGFCLTCG
jgi:hypothetical protein